MTPGPLLVLDTASLYYRSFYAMPSSMTSPDGRPHGAIRGLLSTLTRLVEMHRPSSIVAAWDDDWRPAWRVALMPSYKTHRLAESGAEDAAEASAAEDEPDELSPQITAIAQLLDALGLPRWGAEGHEADDVAASVAAQRDAWPSGVHRCVVVSGDRDLVQLIDERVALLLTVNGGMDAWPLLDIEGATERFGLPPLQYVDMAVLRGDPSDGLPGVAGVGAKTAVSLITAFGGLDPLLARAADGPLERPLTPRIAERLRSSQEELLRARTVATAVRDLTLPGAVPEFSSWNENTAATAAIAEEWGVTRQVEQLRQTIG